MTGEPATPGSPSTTSTWASAAASKRVEVIDGVSFDVRPGEFVSVLGPSGCGKSTLLNMAAGFLAPRRGRRRASTGEPHHPPGQPTAGVVFQQYAIFPWLTVEKNIAFGLTLRRNRRSRAEIEESVPALHRADGTRGLREVPAQGALGRHAAARRPGPRLRHRPRRAAARRALRRARRADPGVHAGAPPRGQPGRAPAPRCSSPTRSRRPSTSPTGSSSWATGRPGSTRSSTSTSPGRARRESRLQPEFLELRGHLEGVMRSLSGSAFRKAHP